MSKLVVNIYNVTKDFYFKLNFLFIKNILKKYHDFYKNIKQHICFQQL